ncbi:MAG: hypothetical protein QM758_07525 [Armatimonas sp.]
MGSAAIRFLILNLGLALYGLAIALQIAAGIGLAPWDAFHVGIAQKIPHATVGMASIGVGIVIQILAWGWLKMPIGLGTALNILAIGWWIDRISPHLPHYQGALAWAEFGTGIFLIGLATGLYVGANFGAGPRDSLALGISQRFGWPVRYVRSGVELIVLACGAALGAKIGWGTLLFALLVGPAMQAGLRVFAPDRLLPAGVADPPERGRAVIEDQ